MGEAIFDDGRNDHWCQHIPDLHRALSDLTQVWRLPTVDVCHDLLPACAYWETLHYLFGRILGWSDIGKGLAWWYAAGKPAEASSALRLVKRVWDNRGQLDSYAAWLWAREHPNGHDWSPTIIASSARFGDERWWRAFKRAGRPFRHDPFHGGANPLHLGHSDEVGLNIPDFSTERVLVWNTASRRATVVVDRFASWMTELEMCRKQLPDVGERSWHVEAFDRRWAIWACTGAADKADDGSPVGTRFTSEVSLGRSTALRDADRAYQTLSKFLAQIIRGSSSRGKQRANLIDSPNSSTSSSVKLRGARSGPASSDSGACTLNESKRTFAVPIDA